MVNTPPVETLEHPALVYQAPVPALERAVSFWPAAPAVSGAPVELCSWTVMTPAAPAQAPATRVRGGVVNARWVARAGVTSRGRAALGTPFTATRIQYKE